MSDPLSPRDALAVAAVLLLDEKRQLTLLDIASELATTRAVAERVVSRPLFERVTRGRGRPYRLSERGRWLADQLAPHFVPARPRSVT